MVNQLVAERDVTDDIICILYCDICWMLFIYIPVFKSFEIHTQNLWADKVVLFFISSMSI